MIDRNKLAELRENQWTSGTVWPVDEMLETLEKLFAVYEAAEELCELNKGHMHDSKLGQALAELRGTGE